MSAKYYSTMTAATFGKYLEFDSPQVEASDRGGVGIRRLAVCVDSVDQTG